MEGYVEIVSLQLEHTLYSTLFLSKVIAQGTTAPIHWDSVIPKTLKRVFSLV